LDHKAILKQLKLCIQLQELHEENPFKIRSYQAGLSTLERVDQDLMDLSESALSALPGIGKSMLEAIQSLKSTGTFPTLDALLAQTPTGVLEMLRIKGLGPKKVRALWQELGLTSTHELLEACQSGKVADTKGFGEKTQETILQNLIFNASNSGKWLYADIEATVLGLQEKLTQQLPMATVRVVGDFSRRLEVIDTGDFLIASDALSDCKAQLRLLEGISWDLFLPTA
jgi:DNA polymerase (family 10)